MSFPLPHGSHSRDGGISRCSRGGSLEEREVVPKLELEELEIGQKLKGKAFAEGGGGFEGVMGAGEGVVRRHRPQIGVNALYVGVHAVPKYCSRPQLSLPFESGSMLLRWTVA
jgi:hypothetical protein